MAKNTNMELRNQVIYQVFVRQYSKSSNFKGVTKDLKRIKALGVDIIYLLPIHPIGKKNKKGSLGCPYSIANYREVNPDLGTLDDFKELILETHKMGLKLIIDVVYNHTSRDSRLLQEHPEWFYKNESGNIANKVGDWWDVFDLDYSHQELREELIDTLCYWATLGVDGFRCDVASLIPLDFWLTARKRLESINPNIILLAESVHIEFLKSLRDQGFEAYSDCELYQAFDMEYDYDIYHLYQDYLFNNQNLNLWLKALRNQEMIYPSNYIKVRCLDNHDQRRFGEFIKDESKFINLLALNYLLKGTTFIYAGTEVKDEKLESLFDIDLINWNTGHDYSQIMQKLSSIKKHPLFKDGTYDIILEELEVAHLIYKSKTKKLECILNLGNVKGRLNVGFKDGKYLNLFNNNEVVVKEGQVALEKEPLVILG